MKNEILEKFNKGKKIIIEIDYVDIEQLNQICFEEFGNKQAKLKIDSNWLIFERNGALIYLNFEKVWRIFEDKKHIRLHFIL